MLQQVKIGASLSMLLVGLLAGACDSKKGEKEIPAKYPDFRYTSADVTGPGAAASTALPVDIYLDGTYSMQGFARPQPSNFSRLLEGIVAAVQNTTKSSDLRYFKYGRSVAPLQRDAFVKAGTDSTFWRDKQFRSETNFAQAVDSTKANRVSIFITDLFYSQGDAQKVVTAIQDNGFRKGIEVGLLGLESDFNGYVADLAPSWREAVPVKGSRPLYLLILGSKPNIQLIFSALRSQSYVQSDRALLLTRYPVKSFTTTAAKARDSKALKNSAERKQVANSANTYAFTWDEDRGSEGTVDYTLKYEAEPYTLPIGPGSLKATIFRKDKAAKDSVADAQSLRLLHEQAGAGSLTGQAQASLKLTRKDYVAYQLTWQYNNLGAVELPAWVRAASTASFTKASPESDKLKTYKLDEFVRSLAVSSATQFEPKYGRLYLVFSRH